MIEIEKKVHLEKHHLEWIEKNATFIKEVSHKDTYFDTEDFSLAFSNKWLRKRDDKFELKAGVQKTGTAIDRYDEITEDQTIAAALHLDTTIPLSQALKKANIIPFVSFVTTRKKFKYLEFILDLDQVDYGEFLYEIGEIELLVTDASQIPFAEEKIETLLNHLKLVSEKKPLGKVAYYLSTERKELFVALLEAKVIKT